MTLKSIHPQFKTSVVRILLQSFILNSINLFENAKYDKKVSRNSHSNLHCSYQIGFINEIQKRQAQIASEQVKIFK